MVDGRWVLGAVLLALFAPAPALAQSVSIDETKQPAPAAPVTAEAPPVPRSAKAPVRPPRPLSTTVDYPEGAHGDADVVLILSVTAEGTVSEVSAESGEPPFSVQALAASRSFRFLPAEREGRAIAAKIRFLVHFAAPTSNESVPAAPPALAAKRPVQPAPTADATYEVVVVGTREPLRHQLGKADVHDMPGAFGDPYRAIESLPGVVPIVSGLPYFYVRGAPPGNVGYFFDGVPVPYLYHFAAGPGVLHPAFVDHVDLYPAAYPARYGRFAGAIVAGEMAEPNPVFRGEASIRIIDSGAMLETPFADGRGSILLGGRFSYTGLVLSLIVPEVTLNYWDYQARIRYQLSAKDRLEILSFGARDFLSQRERIYDGTSFTDRERDVVDVGFHRLDLRWDHALHAGNVRNALLVGFDRTGGDRGNVSVGNTLLGVRSELEETLAGGVQLRAGADLLFESLRQRVNTNGDSYDCAGGSEGPPSDCVVDERDPRFNFDRARRDITAGVRADVVWSATRRVQVIPGLRVDFYNSGGISKVALDPRLSVRYELSKQLSVVHGLSLAHQAPSFVVAVPGFKPSLRGGLQSALQYSAGVSYKLPSDFTASLTVFQNAFFNMTDFIGLAQLDESSSAVSLQDARAMGHAYGLEAMVRRSLARDLGGFLSYTLSRSSRTAGPAAGPATTDRTHVLHVGASYNLGRNWRVGGRVLFYSGVPARVAGLAAAESPPRSPAFWRLDLKLQKRWYLVPSKRVWWGLVFEVLNTTLNKEVLSADCTVPGCRYERLGPITVPSIGAEAAF